LVWSEQVFTPGDLFVTVNCPCIDNLSTFIFAKTSAIEKRAKVFDPEYRLYRIAVLARKPQRHAHLILKSTNFRNDRYLSFSDLVLKQFAKALPRSSDVRVEVIDNLEAVTRYILLQQEECEIDTQSLLLPPFEEIDR
jgi:hypothetical protein